MLKTPLTLPQFTSGQKLWRGAILDWRNPLTQGLCFYVNCIEIPRQTGSFGFPLYDHVARVLQHAADPTKMTSTPFIDAGPAVRFDGTSNSYIKWAVNTQPPVLPLMVPLETADNKFTVAIKFRPENVAAAQHLIGFNDSVGSARWCLQQPGTANLEFNTADTSTTITTAAIVAGNWYVGFGTHIPANTQSVTLFDVNGSLLETKSGTTSVITGGTAEDFSIGGTGNGGVLFTGSVAWAAVWNRILTASEMQDLASDGNILMRPAMSPNRIPFLVPSIVVPGVDSWYTRPLDPVRAPNQVVSY